MPTDETAALLIFRNLIAPFPIRYIQPRPFIRFDTPQKRIDSLYFVLCMQANMRKTVGNIERYVERWRHGQEKKRR